MRNLIAGFLATLFVLFGSAVPALALETQSGTWLEVPVGQTVDDDLMLFGQSITVDGRVEGDLYAFGDTVIINGTITGNLISAASSIEVRGAVGGSVFTAADRITVNGQVSGSLVTAGSSLAVGNRGVVGGNWLGLGDRIDHHGSVGRGMTVGGSDILIRGTVNRELRAGVERLLIESGAVIGGPVTYTSDREAMIAPGAQTGEVTRRLPEQWRPYRSWWVSPWVIALKLGGFLVAGLVTLTLFPRLRGSFPNRVAARPWQAPLAGFLALVAIPVASILLMVTVIGLPLGLLTIIAYPILIYASQILIAWTVGKLLADRVESLQNLSWPVLFTLGAVVTTVLIELPWVGGIAGAASLFYGLGGLYFSLISRSEAA